MNYYYITIQVTSKNLCKDIDNYIMSYWDEYEKIYKYQLTADKLPTITSKHLHSEYNPTPDVIDSYFDILYHNIKDIELIKTIKIYHDFINNLDEDMYNKIYIMEGDDHKHNYGLE